LYKEVNDITLEKSLRPSNTTSDYEPNVDVSSSNIWSTIASNRPYKKNKTRTSDIYQITQPMKNANRYTILTNLPEMTIHQERNEAPTFMKVTQISTNNYMKKKDYR
jgi:hypothetical protein